MTPGQTILSNTTENWTVVSYCNGTIKHKESKIAEYDYSRCASSRNDVRCFINFILTNCRLGHKRPCLSNKRFDICVRYSDFSLKPMYLVQGIETNNKHLLNQLFSITYWNHCFQNANSLCYNMWASYAKSNKNDI